VLARILGIVISLTRGAILLAFAVASGLQGGQDAAPPTPKTEHPLKISNFSGTVVEVTDETLAVVRKSLGRDAVTMRFLRDSATKIEGMLRAKARVTVRYQVFPDGAFKAVYIIVR